MLRASVGNLDLQEAASRVVQSRYSRAAAAGELVPSLTGDASYMRERVSQSLGFSTAGGSGTGTTGSTPGGGSTGGTGTGAGTGGTTGGTSGVSGGGGGGSSEFNVWTLGGGASWEIDLFGRLRRVVESRDAQFQASVEDYRGVFVSLAADTARSYVRVRETQDRRAVAVANANTQRRALDLAQTRLDTGLGSNLDVAQARALLEQTLATLPALEQTLRLEKNALAVLLGERPGAVDEAVDVDAAEVRRQGRRPQGRAAEDESRAGRAGKAGGGHPGRPDPPPAGLAAGRAFAWRRRRLWSGRAWATCTRG